MEPPIKKLMLTGRKRRADFNQYMLQVGWERFQEMSGRVMVFPNMCGMVVGRSAADARLAVKTAWGDDPDAHLCPIVGEVSSEGLEGGVGEQANEIPARYLN